MAGSKKRNSSFGSAMPDIYIRTRCSTEDSGPNHFVETMLPLFDGSPSKRSIICHVITYSSEAGNLRL